MCACEDESPRISLWLQLHTWCQVERRPNVITSIGKLLSVQSSSKDACLDRECNVLHHQSFMTSADGYFKVGLMQFVSKTAAPTVHLLRNCNFLNVVVADHLI